jgi:hypothetical protein
LEVRTRALLPHFGAFVVIEFSDGFQYLKFFAALTLHQRLFH